MLFRISNETCSDCTGYFRYNVALVHSSEHHVRQEMTKMTNFVDLFHHKIEDLYQQD
jgi:hypothetical protein